MRPSLLALAFLGMLLACGPSSAPRDVDGGGGAGTGGESGGGGGGSSGGSGSTGTGGSGGSCPITCEGLPCGMAACGVVCQPGSGCHSCTGQLCGTLGCIYGSGCVCGGQRCYVGACPPGTGCF